MFQKNVTNVGTMRVASGLDSTGHLAEVKEWKEPKETAFDDNIGIWEEGSQCDKARYISLFRDNLICYILCIKLPHC